MLLRTRITLLAAAGFAVLALLLAGASALRDQLATQRLSDTALAALSSIWEEAVTVEGSQLQQAAGRLEQAAAFRQALDKGNRDAATQALVQAGLAPGADVAYDLVAVLGSTRETVFSTRADSASALLDAATFDRVRAGTPAAGLRHVAVGEAWFMAARRITVGGEMGVLVVGRSAEPLLQRLASRMSAQLNLLTLRGQLAATTDAELWKRAAPSVSTSGRTFEDFDLGDRVYTLAGVPVRDIAEGAAGAIVVLADNTERLSASRRTARLATFGSLALVAIGIVILNVYLWRGFRPLGSAIAALQALSRGDASVRLEATGSDEIGSIAKAVAVFRRDAQDLVSARALRERVRRRQETVIRRELQALASATDLAVQEDFLKLLNAPERGDREDEPLRRLASVMGDLRRRIIEQHQTLSGMVIELREALVTKTKLAGLQQELAIAAQLQLSILPRDVPVDPRIRLNHHLTPAKEIGGDFYDYFALDDERFAFIIADVSGKGAAPALFMAITRTLFKVIAKFLPEPATCVRRVNDLLSAENEQMLFVTVFFGVLHLPTGRVTYVNAGHNPPYHLKADGSVVALPGTDGVAVATWEGFEYRESTMHLGPGESLFLFTDGVTEAFDPDEIEYGDAQLAAALATAGVSPNPDRAIATVVQDVKRFVRGAAQSDDITCLGLKYLGPGKA